MVPRLRRAHWERCMAAMCIAEEVSGEAGCRASPGLALVAGLGARLCCWQARLACSTATATLSLDNVLWSMLRECRVRCCPACPLPSTPPPGPAAESLHEAKLHCLLALHLLGVPLPSSGENAGCRTPVAMRATFLGTLAAHAPRPADLAPPWRHLRPAAADEFQGWLGRRGRRWWWRQAGGIARLPAACLGSSRCSCSRATDDDPLQPRAAELQGGAYLWMARPDPRLAAGTTVGSAHSGPSWRRLWRQPAAPAAGAVTPPAAAGHAPVQRGAAQVAELGGGSATGQEAWQLADAAHGTASTFTSTAWGAVPATGAPAPLVSAGPGALGVVGGASLWGIANGASLGSLPPPAAAAPAPGTRGLGGAASDRPLAGMEAVQEEGCTRCAAGTPANLLQPSPFEVQQAAAAGTGPARGPAATPSARQSGSSRLSWSLGRPPAAASGSQLSQEGGQEASQQRQQVSSSGGLQLRLGGTSGSQQYRAWQAAGLAAAAAAEGSAELSQQQQQRGAPASTAPASLSVLPAQSAAVDGDPLQEAEQELAGQQRREQLHQQAVAIGLAGAGWACRAALLPRGPSRAARSVGSSRNVLADMSFDTSLNHPARLPCPSCLLQPQTRGSARKPRRRPPSCSTCCARCSWRCRPG